jgi:hypothetical protein
MVLTGLDAPRQNADFSKTRGGSLADIPRAPSVSGGAGTVGAGQAFSRSPLLRVRKGLSAK